MMWTQRDGLLIVCWQMIAIPFLNQAVVIGCCQQPTSSSSHPGASHAVRSPTSLGQRLSSNSNNQAAPGPTRPVPQHQLASPTARMT
jgi:hypothetical protein